MFEVFFRFPCFLGFNVGLQTQKKIGQRNYDPGSRLHHSPCRIVFYK